MGHRPRTVSALAACALLTIAVTVAVAPATAQAVCDPIQEPPVFDPDVPTGEQVLGFPLGSQEVTPAEANEYMHELDLESERVVSRTAAITVEQRELNYAIVGEPQNVTDAGLASAQAAIQALRDPETPDDVAEQLAEDTPAILWVDGSPHGGEESGGDASLRVLYELAARTDCAADRILDEAIVVIVPIYNPDGRE